MTPAPHRIAGRTVLVTGAARGIGAGAAARLHAAGANVALVDRDAAALERVAARLGERAAAFVADVTDADTLDRAVEGAAERFGKIDVAIANAGVGHVGPFAESTAEELEQTVRVNLLGVLHTDRAVLPQLVASRGYLLNVASLAAALHAPANGVYAATKAGVEAVTDSLRVELAPAGVRVGCAYFGYVDTELQRTSAAHPAMQALRAAMPRFLRGPVPVTAAVDAIEAAVARRSARAWAPRWVGAALVLRGVLQPLSERRAGRDADLRASILKAREGPPHQ